MILDSISFLRLSRWMAVMLLISASHLAAWSKSPKARHVHRAIRSAPVSFGFAERNRISSSLHSRNFRSAMRLRRNSASCSIRIRFISIWAFGTLPCSVVPSKIPKHVWLSTQIFSALGLDVIRWPRRTAGIWILPIFHIGLPRHPRRW